MKEAIASMERTVSTVSIAMGPERDHGTSICLTRAVGGAEHLEEASYVRTLQTRTADMHDCQLGSVAQRARTGTFLHKQMF